MSNIFRNLVQTDVRCKTILYVFLSFTIFVTRKFLIRRHVVCLFARFTRRFIKKTEAPKTAYRHKKYRKDTYNPELTLNK